MKNVIIIIFTLSNLLISASIFAQVAPTPNSPGSGNCLAFNNPNTVVVPTSASMQTINNSVTIEAWVSCTQINNIIMIRSTASIPLFSLFINNTGNATFQFQNSSWTAANAIGNTNLVNTGWHHVAGVRNTNTNTLSIFVDGVLQGTAVDPGGTLTSTSPLRIGRFNFWSALPFIGMMDEVRLWNRALTQAEIRNNMCHTLTGTEPGLVGYWPMDAMGTTCGGATEVCDISGNGNNGTRQ